MFVATCKLNMTSRTYQLIVHARDLILVLSTWTIIVAITEETVLYAPIPAAIIGSWTSEPFEALFGVVAF